MDQPLNLPAQITMIAWSLQEVPPDDRKPVGVVLQRCLELSGLKDLRALKLLKSKGESVFGEHPTYPQASGKDTAQLLQQIQQTLSQLSEIEVPNGAPIATGASWEVVTTSSSPLTLEQTRYSPPLQ
jgi:hypothetical protein